MRVLFLTARFPYPPVKGDKIVSYQRLRHLGPKHEITLLSFCDDTLRQQDLAQVSRFCREIHIVPLRKTEIYSRLLAGTLGRTPLQVLYHRSRGFRRTLEALLAQNQFDLLHVFMLRIAPYVADYPDCPKLIELIDSMQLNMNRRASFEKGIKRFLFREEAKRLSAYERTLAEKFDRAVVVSDRDADVIRARNLVIAPLGVDFRQFHPEPPKDPADDLIVFTGNMRYFPNENAAVYFAEQILPRIQTMIPSVRFWVVGGGPSPRVRQLEDRNPALRVLGFVDSMPEYIRRASVSVCPMLAGSGMQFKILEALACGVPVVATSVAKGDIRIPEEGGLFVADDPVAFAEKVADILRDAPRLHGVVCRARRILEQQYSWRQSNSLIDRIYTELSSKRIRSDHEEGTHHGNHGSGWQLSRRVPAGHGV